VNSTASSSAMAVPEPSFMTLLLCAIPLLTGIYLPRACG
jgi:hypothetical protein